MSRRIGALRASTAARTDARARAAAEAVNGALTVKMLAAGGAVLRRLSLLRRAEEGPIRKMAAIRVRFVFRFFFFPLAEKNDAERKKNFLLIFLSSFP